ncbi:MAG: cytochrome c oxidase subunit II [Gemmatimonadales bacterium]|nr:MAG: cytochrome c oxidase subunit II [Gemmatimonadales bacterium]
MDWSLPLNASTQGVHIDNLFWLIFWITGVAFVLVEVGVLWFLWRYRAREGRKAKYTHGHLGAEIVWTAVPALTMVFLGIYSGRIWADIRSPGSFPENALTIGVTAKQFEWNVTYPGADRVLGNDDDFTIRNRFEFPVGEPVIVRLQSEDVIHSFFVPELRVKQDAVPGMTIPIWFEATQTGEFQIACAELCGLGHYRMKARVVIHDADSFDRWYGEHLGAAQTAAAD